MPTLEVTAYTGLGPGSHDVAVTAVTVKTAKAGGEYLRWEFTDKDGRTATANSSIEITPKNATGRWIFALTGRPVIVGEKRDTAEVIGRPASIFIEETPEGYPKVISVQARQATATTRTATAEAVANAEGTAQAAKEHAAQEGDDLPF